MNRLVINLILILSLAGFNRTSPPTGPESLQQASNQLYLPLLANLSAGSTAAFRINIPSLNGDISTEANYNQTSVFWFGSVGSSSAYSDVRIASNATELWVNLNIFDRKLWYDPTHQAADAANWDGVSLYLNLDGSTGTALSSRSFRFDSQLNDFEARSGWQTAYTGSGGSWTSAALPFITSDGLRWGSNTSGGVNNNSDNRGWTTTYHIPFSSLGLAGAPGAGQTWGIALRVHDRNTQAGPALTDSPWPPSMAPSQPATWAQLHFGLAEQPSPQGSAAGTTTIRQDPAKGVFVPDAGVGGTTPNLCPGGLTYIWNNWGSDNYGSETDFNIQNQSDLADWPCFARYYVSFPLNSIPTNKVILSAKLVLHQFGGSGAVGQAKPSLIQISTVSSNWDENTISWNNAPLPNENVSSALIDVPADFGNWPKVAREWNVTNAAIRAYALGQPLSMALYEADAAYHSGKYFTSSNTEDWNIAGRPTLIIIWGNP